MQFSVSLILTLTLMDTLFSLLCICWYVSPSKRQAPWGWEHICLALPVSSALAQSLVPRKCSVTVGWTNEWMHGWMSKRINPRTMKLREAEAFLRFVFMHNRCPINTCCWRGCKTIKVGTATHTQTRVAKRKMNLLLRERSEGRHRRLHKSQHKCPSWRYRCLVFPTLQSAGVMSLSFLF